MRRARVNSLGMPLVLFIAFQIFPVWAAGQPEESRSEAARAVSNTAHSALSENASLTPSPSTAYMMDEMREQIRAQREQIQKLQSALEQQQIEFGKAMRTMAVNAVTLPPSKETDAPVGSALASTAAQSVEPKIDEVELLRGELEALADNAAAANQRLIKVERNAASFQNSSETKLRQLGNFNFSGDIRSRYEPFFQGGAPDRHRERIRVRFNLTGKLSDEFSGGISLATGSLDDPVSTNQTMTGFFNRKNFAIDKAYITYKPAYARFLKLDAGKFSFPWYRTALTFDSDINPEGFAQTFSFDVKSSTLRNITLVGFQLPIHETSSGYDSFVLGGQLQTQFRLGSKARLALYGAGINFNRMDPLGVAAAARTAGTLVGSLNNSNTLRRSSTGAVLGYATKFAYLDTIMRLELDTHPRFPTVVLFNFVNNVRGPRERSGYWAELTFGRAREEQDVQVAYTFIRIEKDAVIGSWNESDLRSSTNVLNHRLQFAYMFKGNFTGQFTAFIGKLANPLANTDLIPSGVRSACTGSNVSSCTDPYLKRLQFDLIYKF